MDAVNGIVILGFFGVVSIRDDEGVVCAGDGGKAATKFVGIELAKLSFLAVL